MQPASKPSHVSSISAQRLTLMILNAFTIITFLCLIVGNKFVFYINDDKSISNLVSGKYVNHPTKYGVYISQAFALPLSLLYRINPAIPFYEIILIGVMLTCCLIIAYFLCRTQNRRKLLLNAILYLGLFYLLLPQIISPQYTIVAAFPVLAIIVMLTKIPQTKKGKIFYYVGITSLSLLSISIRDNVFLMSLPFIVLMLLYRLIRQDTQLKTAIITFSLCISVIVFNYGVNFISLHYDHEYQTYQEFNYLRSEIQDFYGAPDYDENVEFYESLGISRSAYTLMFDEWVMDIDEANTENFKAILSYQKKHINKSERFSNSLATIKEIYLSRKCFDLVILVLFLTIYLALVNRNKLCDYLFFATLNIGTLIYSILIKYFMKFPPRIAIDLLLFCFISLVAQSQSNIESRCHFSYRFGIYALTVLTIILTVLPMNVLIYNTADLPALYETNEMKINFEQYIKNDSDSIYFEHDEITTHQTSIMLNNNYYLNNLLTSGWASHSPTNNEFFRQHGYQSFNDMLSKATNFKFVVKDHDSVESLNEYVKEKYNREFIFSNQIYQYLQNSFYIYLLV